MKLYHTGTSTNNDTKFHSSSSSLAYHHHYVMSRPLEYSQPKVHHGQQSSLIPPFPLPPPQTPLLILLRSCDASGWRIT